MARKIISEETPEEVVEQSKVQEGSELVNPLTSDGVGSTLITADEMTKLFHEWDANGHTDLLVNDTLAQRIEQYLAYQEQLDPLKRRLAKRIYEPYTCNGYNGQRVSLYVNGTHIGEITIFAASEGKENYRVIFLSDFKMILLTIGNHYAAWMENARTGIDVHAYVVANGGTFSYDRLNDRVEVKL